MNGSLKTKMAFVIVGSASLLLLLQMGLHAVQQFSGAEGRWNLLKLCLITFKEAPFIFFLISAAVNLLIFVTFGRIALRMATQFYLSCKWGAHFRARTDHEASMMLERRYSHWGVPIRVIRDDSLFALAAGLIKPRIFVSTGLLNMLSDREMEAVLLHERHHCMRRDPLKMLVVTICRDAFGYIPLIRGLAHYYRVMKELLADRFVIQQMNTPYELGNVLLKMTKRAAPVPRGIGVSFADTAINYRIEQIIEPGGKVEAPAVRFPAVLVSFLMLVISPYLLLILGGCV
nr:M56 family metallopeptidase [Aneurinibacillus sp. XH2]